MNERKKNIYNLLRENSRTKISDFSKKNGVSSKKTHYEYNKIKKETITKIVPLLDFELLGFKRMLLLFEDATEGLTMSATLKNHYLNNSMRLNQGLLVEYVFFFQEEAKDLLSELKKRKISFSYFFVKDVLKQESFMPS